MACFVVFRRKVPSQPLVVEQCWPTKRARVSGCRRKRSQWQQFGAETEETAAGVTETEEIAVEMQTVDTVETEEMEVHTVDTEATEEIVSEMHTEEPAVEVHTEETEEMVHTEEFDRTEPAFEFQEVIASTPVKKTKMISELVCAVQPKTRNAKVKKGTRRGRKK